VPPSDKFPYPSSVIYVPPSTTTENVVGLISTFYNVYDSLGSVISPVGVSPVIVVS
jgi:hypothetical protein